MSRDVAPHIDDGNLVIDDIIIAPEDDVSDYEQTQDSATDGRDSYRVIKTDGTIKDVTVLRGQPGAADASGVYTKAEVNALLQNVSATLSGISFDPTTREIVITAQ